MADRNDIEGWLRDVIDDAQMGEVADFFDGIDAERASATEYREGAEARMKEYEEQVNGLTSSISDLKARNYDLLMQVPAEQGGGDGAVIDKVEDDGEVIHIDNLFVDPEKEMTNNAL